MFTRSKFSGLLAATGACLALALPVAAATNASALNPQPKRWLRWLGPLAPQGAKLPVVPAPIADPRQAWTIEQALARALQANPDVQVALTAIERQEGIRAQAAGALFPRLSVVASMDQRATSLIDRSAEELARAGNPLGPGLTPIAERSYNAQAELRQVLFDGFASWNQLRRMAALEKKASVDARDLYLRIAAQVRQSFDVTLARQSILSVRQDAVRDLTHLADVADKRFRAGEISEYESLRARSVLASAQADAARAAAELERAQEMFCRILYIDMPPEGVRLTGNLVALDYKDTFEVALSRAQAARLDVRSARLQLDAAQSAHRAAMGSHLPRVEAYVSYGYRSSYYDVHREIEGWTVGVVGRWDIFDWGQTAGAVRAQRAERRAAEIKLADTQKQVGSQVRELFASLAQMKTVMAAQAAARDLGQRSVDEARKSYEAGKLSVEAVLNSELIYRQAYVGWLGAVFDYNSAVYQLDYATAEERFLNNTAPAAK